MAFEVSRLVGQHRIGSGVALVESVFGKADHIVEYFLGYRLRYAVAYAACYLHIAVLVGLAVDEIFFFFQHDIHFFLGHGPAHQVGTAVAVAAQIPYDLHYLLLIYQAAVSHAEDRFEGRMEVSYLFRIFLVFDIFGDGIHRSRSVEGHSRNYVLKAVWLERFHELGHALAFQLKNSLGVAL